MRLETKETQKRIRISRSKCMKIAFRTLKNQDTASLESQRFCKENKPFFDCKSAMYFWERMECMLELCVLFKMSINFTSREECQTKFKLHLE